MKRKVKRRPRSGQHTECATIVAQCCPPKFAPGGRNFKRPDSPTFSETERIEKKEELLTKTLHAPQKDQQQGCHRQRNGDGTPDWWLFLGELQGIAQMPGST